MELTGTNRLKAYFFEELRCLRCCLVGFGWCCVVCSCMCVRLFFVSFFGVCFYGLVWGCCVSSFLFVFVGSVRSVVRFFSAFWFGGLGGVGVIVGDVVCGGLLVEVPLQAGVFWGEVEEGVFSGTVYG